MRVSTEATSLLGCFSSSLYLHTWSLHAGVVSFLTRTNSKASKSPHTETVGIGRMSSAFIAIRGQQSYAPTQNLGSLVMGTGTSATGMDWITDRIQSQL
jgi:hypothetical protein